MFYTKMNLFRKYFKTNMHEWIDHQNDIVIKISEEACVSAEICDGAVQLLVPWKFA